MRFRTLSQQHSITRNTCCLLEYSSLQNLFESLTVAKVGFQGIACDLILKECLSNVIRRMQYILRNVCGKLNGGVPPGSVSFYINDIKYKPNIQITLYVFYA